MISAGVKGSTVRLRCGDCGQIVSNEVPAGIVIRGWIVCPECIERIASVLPGGDLNDVLKRSSVNRKDGVKGVVQSDDKQWGKYSSICDLPPAERRNLPHI